MFVGASMGATAVLLYCDLCTVAIAFNPEVDVTREKRLVVWLGGRRLPKALRSNMFHLISDTVHRTKARVFICLSGPDSPTQGDVYQASLLGYPKVTIDQKDATLPIISRRDNPDGRDGGGVSLFYFPECGSHGLPMYLKKHERLLPLLKQVFGAR